MADDKLVNKVKNLNSFSLNDMNKKAALTKEISKLLREESKQFSEMAICATLETISELYFSLQVRDPLKKSLKSLINDVEELYSSFSLGPSLCKSLESEDKSKMKLGCENITACLDGFPLGLKAVLTSIKQVFQYLHNCIRTIHDDISRSPGPQEVTQLFSVLQSVFKAVSLTVQECSRSAVVVVHEHNELLADIYSLVLDFLINDSTLLNSRHSSGIVLANIFKLFFPVETHESVHKTNLKIGDHPIRNVYVMEDVSYPTQLSAWGGLLAGLSPSDLVSTDALDGHCLLSDDIFPKIINVQGGKEDPSILLSHARTVFLWTEKTCETLKLCNLQMNELSRFSGTSSIGNQLFNYVWSVWDHFMDGVRFHARAIFENAVTMHLLCTKGAPSDDVFLQDLCKQLMLLPWYQKGKYGVLCHLVSRMGSKTILGLEPQLLTLLIEALKDGSLASYAGELVCVLCEHHLSAVDLQQWQSYWVEPLLTGLGSGTKTQKSAIQQQIFPKLFKLEAKLLPFVLQRLSEKSFINKDGSLAVLLSCLKIAKSSKVPFSKMPSDASKQSDLWKDCVPYSLLETALCHSDEQVRLDALGLVCDSTKTSEPFSEKELGLMETFIRYNINVQSPAFRQKMLGFVKKFLNRICDSVQQILKKKPTNVDNSNEENSLVVNYRVFLDWFWSFLFSSLHPEANFPRRGSALQIIILMKEIVGLHSQNEDRRGLQVLVTPCQCQTILECLRDTYENNKQLALQFLSGLPDHLLLFQDKTNMEDLLHVSFQLASSIRPTDSITAAYLLQAISVHSQKENIVSSVLGLPDDVCMEGEQVPLLVHYILISSLLKRLQKELGTASISLMAAAAREPMYGTLACIRYLLMQASPQLGLVEDNEKWKSLISQLIEVSMEVTDAVQPVVCNASPEGHLPMDTNPESISQLQTMIQKAVGRRFMHAVVVPPSGISGPEFQPSQSNPNSAVLELDLVKTRAVTAQMLLLCSWRTHREVSLLLGHLCQAITVASDGKSGLLTAHQMRAMGDFFIRNLSEIKHRGAFEEAYVGFCKLCSRLWRSEAACLHELPHLWLRDLLSAVSSANDDAMCLTRRSAGLPFIVQALLISEPEGANGASFKAAMESLLKLAIPEMEQELSFASKSRVHAINILRALYREANLGESVMPYVADGLQAAILGFKGNTWMLRNAATLLLSTLITRVFGVNRSRENELQKKNCMTGRVFFQRFPTLFPFLLQELKDANLSLHHVSSIYPVLLLLSRLYPSPIEGSDSHLQLGAFLPHVERCGRSDLHLTRRLAARALVPLLSPHSVAGHLKRMFGILSEHCSQNCLHGTLLQISNILEEISNQPTTVQEEIRQLVPECLSSTAEFLVGSRWCTPVKTAYLDMSWSCLNNGVVCPPVLCKWVYKEALDICHSSNLIGGDCYEADLTKLLLATNLTPTATTNINVLFAEVVPKLLNPSRSYESRMVTLDFLSWLLDRKQECLGSRSLDMVPLKHRHAWSGVCDENKVKEALATVQQSAASFYQLLQSALENETHSWCRTELLYILSSLTLKSEGPFSCSQLEGILSALIPKANEEHVEDEAVSMLHYSAQLAQRIFVLGKKEEYISPCLGEWASFLYMCSQPDGSAARRQAAAGALCTCSHLLTDVYLEEQWGVIVGPLWDTYILLLQDDEPDIRDSLSHLILQSTDNECRQPVVSSLALDQALGCMIDVWAKNKSTDCFSFLLDLALRSDHNTASENNMIQGSDEQPFDKGELNVFAEEVALTNLACKHLNKLLDISFSELNLTIKLPRLNWLHAEQTALPLSTFLSTCLTNMKSLASELAACTIDSVFMCHLFDSLCIQIYQRVQVLSCFFKRVTDVQSFADSSELEAIICQLESWPKRNYFLTCTLDFVKGFQKAL